jgi:hypothetical protein
VRVELGGRREEAALEIANDPRSTATEAELRAQYELGLRLWRLLSDVYDGVNRARAARKKLGDGESEKELARALEAVEADLVAGGGGKRSLYLARTGLDTRLRSLRQLVAEGPPTASTHELAGQPATQVAEVLERVRPLVDRARELERQAILQ